VPTNTCNSCKYWDPPVALNEHGTCHRYPPSGSPQTSVGEFAFTFPTDWCGEFVAAAFVHEYTGHWTWNSAASPAVDGDFRSDSRNWSGAVIMSFGTHDNTGIDATNLWGAMAVGDTIHVVQTNNSSNWSDYTLQSAFSLDGPTSYKATVTRTGGTGQASNGQNTTATFFVAG
jgi:hypothetical protein